MRYSSGRIAVRYLGPVWEDKEPPLVEVESGPEMRCHIPLEARRLQAAGEVPGTVAAGAVPA